MSAMYAGSTIHYRELLKNFRGEDFDYTFLTPENRFTFMGNGISKSFLKRSSIHRSLDLNNESKRHVLTYAHRILSEIGSCWRQPRFLPRHVVREEC